MTSIKAQLDRMLKRALTLHGHGYKQVELEDGKTETLKVAKEEAVNEFLTTLAGNCDAKDKNKEMAEKIIAAWDDPTGKLQQALNATRVEAVGNFIASESTFKSAFFTTVTLAADEEPWYTNTTKNEIRIGTMGHDGTPERVRVLLPYDRTAVGLYTIASDIVRYKTEDIYRGDVSQTALKTIDIARDLRFKLDRVHYDLLTASVANGGCFGAFSTEQARSNKATRIYLPHSGIVTSHLPTTNAIVNGTDPGPTGTRWTCQYYDEATDSGGSATDYVVLRPAVLLVVLDYCASWGNLLPDSTGQLAPTGEIIVPSSDIIGFALHLQPKLNMVSTDVQKQITENGYFGCTMYGRNWRFIPDVTIPSGTCYPRLNMLPGISYEKPSWSKEFTTRNEIENWEERWQKQAYGLVIPSQWRVRAMKVTYVAA